MHFNISKPLYTPFYLIHLRLLLLLTLRTSSSEPNLTLMVGIWLGYSWVRFNDFAKNSKLLTSWGVIWKKRMNEFDRCPGPMPVKNLNWIDFWIRHPQTFGCFGHADSHCRGSPWKFVVKRIPLSARPIKDQHENYIKNFLTINLIDIYIYATTIKIKNYICWLFNLAIYRSWNPPMLFGIAISMASTFVILTRGPAVAQWIAEPLRAF